MLPAVAPRTGPSRVALTVGQGRETKNMARITVNNQRLEVDASPDTPLLWVLRDHLGDDRHQVRLRNGPVRCVHRACRRCCDALVHTAAADRSREKPSRPSRACRKTALTRCSAPGSNSTCRNAGIASPDRSCRRRRCCKSNPHPSDAEIDAAMAGNICRCGTYARIRKAIHRATELLPPPDPQS